MTIGFRAKLLGTIRSVRAKSAPTRSLIRRFPNSTVVGNPGHTRARGGRRPRAPSDWSPADPIADCIGSSRAGSPISSASSPPATAARIPRSPRSCRCATSADRTPPVASFSHTVNVAKPPAEVFPWLLEEDKVPQWTGRLQAYEVLGDGTLGSGTKIRQVLTISGQPLDLELEIVRYEPPGFAESRFSTNGGRRDHLHASRAGAGTTYPGGGNASSSGRLLVRSCSPSSRQAHEARAPARSCSRRELRPPLAPRYRRRGAVAPTLATRPLQAVELTGAGARCEPPHLASAGARPSAASRLRTCTFRPIVPARPRQPHDPTAALRRPRRHARLKGRPQRCVASRRDLSAPDRPRELAAARLERGCSPLRTCAIRPSAKPCCATSASIAATGGADRARVCPACRLAAAVWRIHPSSTSGATMRGRHRRNADVAASAGIRSPR